MIMQNIERIKRHFNRKEYVQTVFLIVNLYKNLAKEITDLKEKKMLNKHSIAYKIWFRVFLKSDKYCYKILNNINSIMQQRNKEIYNSKNENIIKKAYLFREECLAMSLSYTKDKK